MIKQCLTLSLKYHSFDTINIKSPYPHQPQQEEVAASGLTSTKTTATEYTK